MDMQETIAFHPKTANGANTDRKYFIDGDVFLKVNDNVVRGQNEARILASISHPYIQKYIDSCVVDGKHILKTEYFRSETLENLSLRDNERKKIESQVFDILSYLVDNRVVHGDINVSNILFDGEKILLIDWENSREGDALEDLVGPPTSTNHCGIINVINSIRWKRVVASREKEGIAPLDIKEDFINHPLTHFKEKVNTENEALFGKYDKAYDYLSLSHPVYNRNWRVNFLDRHRFMNWVLYSFLTNARHGSNDVMFTSEAFSGDFTVMDIGCYDSCLVAALNNNGVRAYGYDHNDWLNMFSVLGTTHKVNSENKKENIDVAVVLNYAHTFRPDDLLKFVEEKCGNMPSLIFFDFDANVQHEHHHLYEASRSDYTTIRFAASEERELYIWHG